MRPIYIVCAEVGVEDKVSGLVSLVNLLEKFSLGSHTFGTPPTDEKDERKPSTIIGTVRFLVMAVWMKEDGEDDKKFEARFRVIAPGREPFEIEMRSFSIPVNKFLHRLRLSYDGPAFFRQSGMVRFVSEVREVGTSEWKSQEYPVIVEVDSSFEGYPDVRLESGPPVTIKHE